MKKLRLALLVILVIAGIIFIDPVSIYHSLDAERTINDIFADPEVARELLGVELVSPSVSYAGKNIYHLETGGKKFLIQVESSKRRTSINIFEFELMGELFH